MLVYFKSVLSPGYRQRMQPKILSASVLCTSDKFDFSRLLSRVVGQTVLVI